MSLIDLVFQEPELRDSPPVLVDIGAAGGVIPVWRDIARHCIGVGFEPDARDAARLGAANSAFRHWVYIAGLVAPTAGEGERKRFFLTSSPHCSSLLRPRTEALKDWLFADLFIVQETVEVPAVTLAGALVAHGLDRIDWLKCDTQGLDLSLYLSLPDTWRRRMLAVEFEPGLIDAYEGEDKFWQVLRAMEAEPFWISDLHVCGTRRGNTALFRKLLGERTTRWAGRIAPVSPGWVNVRYLRSLGTPAGQLDRRDLLLAWVFADLLGQHAHALTAAHEGAERFDGGIFKQMAARSARRLRWSMLAGFPDLILRRLGLRQ